MRIEACEFTGDHYDEWNEFVEHSNNGTLFHRLDFLDYHPDDRFDEHHLMFNYKGQNLVGVMPLALDESDAEKIANSPYGGSYGGIVTGNSMKFRYAKDVVSAMIDHLKEKGIDRIRIRPTPREQHISPSSYMEFHYHDHGFKVVDKEVTSVVDLNRIDDDPFDIYNRSCRNKVRKAKREDVEVSDHSHDWEAFYEILAETWDRHEKTPTHTLPELRDLYRRFPDRVKLSMAYHEDEPVAGILQFFVSSTTNFHFYNCHREEYRDLAPVNLLIDTEIRRSLEEGFRYFDFGTTVENYDWNDGLMTFKESFGAMGHFRNVFELEL